MKINLLKERCDMRKWIIKFLVYISHSLKMSFFNFFQNFICKVLVTDDVLSSIGSFELMEFHNKINQLYFEQDQEAAINSVRNKMLTMGISIIEQTDLVVGAATSNKKGTSLGVASRKMTRTLWITINWIKSSVTTTFHPAPNWSTRLNDKQQSSGYLTVGVTSEFQRLLSWCRPQVWPTHYILLIILQQLLCVIFLTILLY